MKAFGLIVLGLIIAASAYKVNWKGGYKQNAKYIYQYEAVLRPGQIQSMKKQFIEIRINCAVEIHPISHEKFFLQITKHNITARLSDPRFTNGPVDYISYEQLNHLSPFLEKPIKFKYSGGIVEEVCPLKDDARFSVNLKKGIINLFHVDINGKDKETERTDLFTKMERSVYGKCLTSYNIRDFKLMDSRGHWEQMGFNITKAIDLNNCIESDFEVFNKVVPGPNEQQATNPLKSSGTINLSILGTKDAFKIEEVHAIGMHVLYLTSKDEGGIDSVTEQRLKLIERHPIPIGKDEAAEMENNMVAEPLSMNVKSFGNIEQIPKLTRIDEDNIVKLVKGKMTRLTEKLPDIERLDSKDTDSHLQIISTDMLHVVRLIRTIKKHVHARIWEKCNDTPNMRKWLLYAYSLCGTHECTFFMQDKIQTLNDDLISHFLLHSSCNGNPTLEIVNSFQEILKCDKIRSSPYLTKMGYLSATNIIKTYCRQTTCKSTWIDKVLSDALQNIMTSCNNTKTACRPLQAMPVSVVIALAENVQRPALLNLLKEIVLNEDLPLYVRVKAVSAVRPLIKIIPDRVRVLMVRVVRDLSLDKELRMLCFSVLMDNPTVSSILIIARGMRREPIEAVRRFVYDKWIAMRYTKLSEQNIVTAVRLALKLFPKHQIPSRLSSLTNCYQLNWFSKKWTTGALWHQEEIYRTNFLPTTMNYKLNFTVLGRDFTAFETQLRVEGLQELMGKLIGPKSLIETKSSLLDLLKRRPALGKLSNIFKAIDERLPTFTVPEHEFRIFSQLSIFDKILHADEAELRTSDDLSLPQRFLRFAEIAEKLQNGLEYKFSKPLIPVEVIYRMPSLAGVTMTTNLTSLIVPVSISKLKLETVPKLMSLKMLTSRKIESLKVVGKQKLCAIADMEAVINFRIPSLELGAYVKTTLNISTALSGYVDYDAKTNTFITDMEAPETAKEVMTFQKGAYHYLKCDKCDRQPISKKISVDKKLHRERRSSTDQQGSIATPVMSTVRATPKLATSAGMTTATSSLSAPLASEIQQSRSTIGALTSSAFPLPLIKSVESERVEERSFLKVPIDTDGWKDMEVLGLKAESPRWEQWTLKINGKFVSVSENKVVLTDTPTTLKVSLHGEHQRILRILVPEVGYLTVPKDSPCLVIKKERMKDGQFFVVKKHGPNMATIRTIVHLKTVPNDWSIAKEPELKEMEEMEEDFQSEMFPLNSEFLDEEEKVEPSKQKARLVHWMAEGNLVCLTPLEKKAAVVETFVKTPRIDVLRRSASKNGICYGVSTGLETCLHGFRPHPIVRLLSLIVAPMEYRLRIMPVAKEWKKSHISLKVVQNREIEEESQVETSRFTVTIGNKGSVEEKKLIVTLIVNWGKTDMMLLVEPHGLLEWKFKKFCLKLTSKQIGATLRASFDSSCSKQNLEVDVITTKTFPRYWLTMMIKHNPIGVPEYIIRSLSYVINDYVMPILRSIVDVYPRPRFSKEFEKTDQLHISLIKNDTLRFHLKTQKRSYILNDVRLPTAVKSLPIGTQQISAYAKLHHLTRPQCLHDGRKFVTFDGELFQFTPRGGCEHSLLRICDGRQSNIAVTVKRVKQTMKRVLTISADTNQIRIIPNQGMNQKPIVKINDLPVAFHSSHQILDPKTKAKMLTIIWEETIKCLTVKQHKYDLVVKLLRSHHVSVRISAFFANKTCGLCGNYNGEKFDDFVTPEGRLINDVARPTLFYSQVKDSVAKTFALSWIVTDSKCSDDCPFTRKLVTVKAPDNSINSICLTNVPIIQCYKQCPSKDLHDLVQMQATCVPKSMAEHLKKYLLHGTTMDLSKSTDIIAKVSLPMNCKCKC